MKEGSAIISFPDTHPDVLPNWAEGIVFRVGRLRCAETVLLFLRSTVFCLGATIIKNVTCSPLHPRTGQMEVSVDIKAETNDAPARLAGIVVDRITGRSLGRATLRGCPAEPLVSGQYRVVWDALADAAFRPLNRVELRLFAEPIPEGKEEEAAVIEEKERPALLYYCTFDNASAISTPAAGPSGAFFHGEFGPGKTGNALRVERGTAAFETRFAKGVLGTEGCIEFWAKIEGDNSSYGDGGDPLFFSLYDERGAITLLQFAANNGFGRGGLGGAIDSWPFGTVPHYAMSMEYANILGSDWAGWHHYAMSWKSNGFPDGSYVKVFVDGTEQPVIGGIDDEKVPGRLANYVNHDFVFGSPWPRSRGDNRSNRNPFWLDEMKIWSVAKTEFNMRKTPLEKTASPKLLFHCTLDSADAIIACGGTVTGAEFVEGVKGKAVHIEGGAPVIFPMKGTIPDLGRGCVDFWARISNEGRMELLPEAELNLVRLRRVGERDNIYFRIVYTANDGQAHGGLVGQMADNVIAATQSFGTFSADTIVGGAASDWHRYTVSWDAHGIDGTPDTLAVYVDGRKIAATQGVPNMQEVWNRKDYVLFVGETRDDQVSVEIDELRYWDHAIVPDPLESGMGLVEQ